MKKLGCFFDFRVIVIHDLKPVSYTHLDVYKRQVKYRHVGENGVVLEYHSDVPFVRWYIVNHTIVDFENAALNRVCLLYTSRTQGEVVCGGGAHRGRAGDGVRSFHGNGEPERVSGFRA